MKKILITLFLIMCAVTSAQNFFPTKQGDIYQIEEVTCLLYTSPSPRDRTRSRMPPSA